MKTFFLIFSLCLITFAHANSDELIDLNIQDLSLDETNNHSLTIEIPDFLSQRSEHENVNIVLVPINGNIDKSDDFNLYYAKEKLISNWVVIFNNFNEKSKIEEVIKKNLDVFDGFMQKIAPKSELISYVRTFNASGNAFNKMMRRICNFEPKIMPIETLNKITVSTRYDYPKIDFCKSYPVILGASSILMEFDGKDFILRNMIE